jgi:ribA/ribD-fused uncharacterized protein
MSQQINRADHLYKNGDYKRYFYADDKKVFGFFEDYRFLSNFHVCEVLWDGHIWKSSEHAYMASKCLNIRRGTRSGDYYHNHPVWIINGMTCAEVKRWGQTVDLRDGWDDKFKAKMMYSICLDKFTRNPDLRQKLLATEDRELIEANNWGDEYYGYNINSKNGKNVLGKILMKIRERLK